MSAFIKNPGLGYKMAQCLRREVLGAFKSLHRARRGVFEGDVAALQASRLKINEEFKKNKHVAEASSISELVQYAKAVEKGLKETVIQAREVQPGRYEAKLRPETLLLDGAPARDNPSKL